MEELVKKKLYVASIFMACSLFGNGAIELTHNHTEQHAMQPIIKDGCYFNHVHEHRFKHVQDALKIFWATKTSNKKYFTTDYTQWIKHDEVVQHSMSLQVQWIGHATFLMQVNEFNILTDPVFYDLNGTLYPRKTPVGVQPDALPHIDFVIISHNHRDHLDEPSMLVLKKHQPIMLVPQGTKEWFTSRGFERVIENSWWQATQFQRDGRTIEFTFLPAVHWSGRHMLDAHCSLWGGWLMRSNNKTVYFAGDTGFKKDLFNAIKEYAGSINCALMPIGPCEPRSLMCHSHMGPEDAVAAYKILEPTLFIPMHWGTFGLGPDSFDDPIKLLDKSWYTTVEAEHQHALYTIKFGERINVH